MDTAIYGLRLCYLRPATVRTKAALRSRQSAREQTLGVEKKTKQQEQQYRNTSTFYHYCKNDPSSNSYVQICFHRNVGAVLKLGVCYCNRASTATSTAWPHYTAPHPNAHRTAPRRTAPHLGRGEVALSILGRRDEAAGYVHPLARPARERLPRHLAPQLLKLLAKKLHPGTCQERTKNDSSTRRRAC